MEVDDYKFFHPLKKPSLMQIFFSAFLGILGLLGAILVLFITYRYLQFDEKSYEILTYLIIGLMVAAVFSYFFLSNTVSYWKVKYYVSSYMAFTDKDFIYYYYDKKNKMEIKEIIPIKSIYKIDEVFNRKDFILKIYFINSDNIKKVFSISDTDDYMSTKPLKESLEEEWQKLINTR